MRAPSWKTYLWTPGNAWMGLAHRVTWTIQSAGRTSSELQRAIIPAWGLIGLLAGALGIVSWGLLATGVWMHHTRNLGYASVTWSDVAFPWNWDRRRHKQGKELLARVQEQFRERKYREGLFSLQAGLRLAPEDLAARRTFATIQQQLGRVDLATQLLAEGLPYSLGDASFASLAIDANLAAQEFDRVLELTAFWFSQENRAREADRSFHAANSQALGYLGRTAEALAALDAGGLSQEALGALLRAQAQWVNGDRVAALETLRAGSEKFPADDALRLRLVQYAGSANRKDLAEAALRARIQAEPRNAARVLDLIRWHADEGDWVSFERELETHIRRSAESETAQLATAKLLARLGRVDAFDTLLRNHTPSAKAAPVFALARVDALIVARSYEQAHTDLKRWKETWLEGHPNHGIDLSVAEALILTAQQENGPAEAALAKVLASEQLGPRGLLTVATRFTDLQQASTAIRLLRRALELAPNDPVLLRTASLTAADSGDWETFSELIDRILARRHIDPALLQDLAERLNSDRSLFVPARDTLMRKVQQSTRTTGSGGA